ncbi:hypothetical protein M0805_007835 [Coniferiporia weirii]|nr:hypothetical protein M0805_007835 [Coniferiporia weirii]
MKIPITIIVHDQNVSTNALIDSGAEGKFIDAKFIIKNRIPTKPLRHPIHVKNVDGTPNQHGTITRYSWRKQQNASPSLDHMTTLSTSNQTSSLETVNSTHYP